MRREICGAPGVVEPLRRHWRLFRSGRPGRRFQDFYARKRGSRGGALYRCAAIVLGALLCLVGIFFMAVPGPGIPIFALGAVMIAQQSLVTARLLDRTEIRLRRLVRSRAGG